MDRLRASLTDVPIVSMEDYQYFVHPLTDGVPAIDPALLRDVANEIIRRVSFDGVDYILAPEAMGIHLGTAVSLQVDCPLAIARKRSYDLPSEVSVAQSTGYDENELFINGIEAGDTVVIVDDVASTGGTLRALRAALEEIGAELRTAAIVFDKRDQLSEAGHVGESVTGVLAVAIEDDTVVSRAIEP